MNVSFVYILDETELAEIKVTLKMLIKTVEVVCFGLANWKDTQSSLYLPVSISNKQKSG